MNELIKLDDEILAGKPIYNTVKDLRAYARDYLIYRRSIGRTVKRSEYAP